MNSDQVQGIIRTAAAYGFGILTAKGYIDSATALSLASAVATIGVAIWSYASKKKV